MSPESPAPEEAPGRGFPGARQSVRSWIELAGAWSLAIAWPIYQRLQAGPEALTFFGVRGFELLLFALLISLAAPTVLWLAELVLGRLASRRISAVFHALVLGILLGLVVWQILQGYEVLALVVWAGLIAAISLLYLRHEFVRTFVLLMGLALPVVLALFLFSYPMRYEVLPGEKAMANQSTDTETPVVAIVLDELPLALITDQDGRIDRRLLPEAARLARESTWYPRTFGVADETLAALPAIMTGIAPVPGKEPPPPGLPSYPDSLCKVTSGAGYRQNVQQILTDLCGRKTSIGTRVADLLRSGLYPQTDLYETPSTDSITPGRFLENRMADLAARRPPPPSVWSLARPDYARQFTRDLDLEPRGFNFMHLLLPHAPFQFTEDGTGYANQQLTDTDTTDALQDPDNLPEANKSMQQNLAQTIFSFKLVEQTIKRMKAEGTWDKSLFVLTADHGASFRLGSARRTIGRENAGWLIRVPLFIKYPGQGRGRVDRRFVSSKDIAPTVLDVLGLKPPPEAEGVSLLDEPAGTPERLEVVSSDGDELSFTPDQVERQFKAAEAMRTKAFGAGTLYAIGGHPDLLGTRADRFQRLKTDFVTAGPELDVASLEFFVPTYFQAEFPDQMADPGPLGIAVNGRIAATTRAWRRRGTWMAATNLPAAALRVGPNHLQVVRLDSARSVAQRP